uniref:Aspartate aminotransferase n=1 Tax=Rhabditophanes sp. KR3021 TaxID=114890 RepID=A0AC35TG15_9BILA
MCASIDLSFSAYRTEQGKPWVLPVVREAEKRIAEDSTLNHEYLPVLGYEPFTSAATEFVLGSDSIALKEGRGFGIQCLSGTGSLRVGAESLHDILKLDTVYVSDPTWGNHNMIFEKAGFTSINKYSYWDAVNKKVDIANFVADLESAPEKAVIVLHGCAHNPTGMDCNQEQWKQIAEVIKRRNLFTFFDIAYQGFASGDPDADAWAIRYFVDQGIEMIVSQSFAKNFGLYNERVGNLTIVVKDPKEIAGLKSQISLIIRANWSNPPANGARIVHMILTDPVMKSQWFDCIKEMSSRIKKMRHSIRSHLEALGTPGTWDHITQQIGMFSYTGLTAIQANHLATKHFVFLLSDGRINLCGLNEKNVEYVAKAIDETVRNINNKL